jgi:2-dehydro-3-deoxygluconokinase
MIRNHARAGAVDLSHLLWVPYDGVGKVDRVGLNFTEVGMGPRASVTLYDRGHSAASHMKPEDIAWKKLFVRGARWFHTSGVFTALSSSSAKTAHAALKTAHDNGVITSYDLNFRSALWSREEAWAATKDMVPHVTVLIGNEDDFEKILGFKKTKKKTESRAALDAESYKQMVERVVQAYPNLKVVGTTLREVKSGLLNHWETIVYSNGKFYQSRRYENLEIEDRVGGGDGFVSGLAYGFLTDLPCQEIVEFAAAHGALLQSTRGDTSQVSLEEVRHVMRGGSAHIRR